MGVDIREDIKAEFANMSCEEAEATRKQIEAWADNRGREDGYREHLKALFDNKSYEEAEAIFKHMEACRKEAEAEREKTKARFDNMSHKQVEAWLQYLYDHEPDHWAVAEQEYADWVFALAEKYKKFFGPPEGSTECSTTTL